MADIDAARLRELLDYDPATGQFTWRVKRRGRFARIGQRAGSPRKDGRQQICIDQQTYIASRLAVLWMTGEWPQALVDHRNCDPSDDRWSNLRPATFSQNGANSRDRKSGVSLKGVTRHRNGRYDARIKINYRNKYLGRFKTPEAAHAAYAAAACEHFGEFARRQ